MIKEAEEQVHAGKRSFYLRGRQRLRLLLVPTGVRDDEDDEDGQSHEHNIKDETQNKTNHRKQKVTNRTPHKDKLTNWVHFGCKTTP